MEKANSKILTVSFAVAGILLAITISILIKAFAGAFGVVARASDTDIVRHGIPVLAGFALFLSLQFNSKVQAWAAEVVSEIQKVVWPSRKDTTAMTIACIVMVFVCSIIISVFDVVSGFFINLLMK